MPWNGSGGYNRIRNWQADAAANIKIKADFHDAEDDAFASGISNCIAKDGQSAVTADIPFNNHKITGLADPVNDQDAVTKKYMLGAAATQGLFTKVGFASADMSLLGRAAGAPAGTLQRIAYNDKADGTGNDVFVVNDDGTVSARAADGTYKVYAPATAQARNRIINGAMQVSQENGNTALGPAAALATYAADQWLGSSVLSPGTVTQQRIQAVTPNGSQNRIRMTVNVAKAALAAGDYLQLRQPLEGIKIADFRWGTAQAKQIVARFGFKAPAGTYALSLMNGAGDRSYVALFTISAGQANTDTEQVFVIPGDVIGTWPTDTSVAIYFRVILAAGTTSQGAAGWQAGAIMTTSAQTNGMASTSNVFELYDVGLHLDPDATGLAPKWVMPDEAEELQACQRYFQRYTSCLTTGYNAAGGSVHLSVPILTMRTTPAYAFDTISYTNASTLSSNTSSPSIMATRIVIAATGYGFSAYNVNLNARM